MSKRKPKVEVYKGYINSWAVMDGNKPPWYWRIRAANGRIIADGGEGYVSKRNAIRAFESVKEAVMQIEWGEIGK